MRKTPITARVCQPGGERIIEVSGLCGEALLALVIAGANGVLSFEESSDTWFPLADSVRTLQQRFGLDISVDRKRHPEGARALYRMDSAVELLGEPWQGL